MNPGEISRQLDKIYSNMTKEELQNKLKEAGFIIFDGPYGFIELEDWSLSLEPIAYSTTKPNQEYLHQLNSLATRGRTLTNHRHPLPKVELV